MTGVSPTILRCGRQRIGVAIKAIRLVKNVLLVVCVIVALAVSLLSDIPEVIPPGREIGIVLSQIAFAYIGAFIFDLVINELPRREKFRKVYAATWDDLSQIANNGDALLVDLQFIADVKTDERWPLNRSEQHIKDVCTKIEFGDILEAQQVNVAKLARQRADVHELHYKRIAPYVLAYESDVVAALGEINGSYFFYFVGSLPEERIEAWHSVERDGRSATLAATPRLLRSMWRLAPSCATHSRARSSAGERPRCGRT